MHVSCITVIAIKRVERSMRGRTARSKCDWLHRTADYCMQPSTLLITIL